MPTTLSSQTSATIHVATGSSLSSNAATYESMPLPLALKLRAVLSQQLAQNGTMAVRLIRAIAPDGEVGPMRQRGQQLDGVVRIRPRHLRAVLPHEDSPLRRRFCLLRELHGLETRREGREPQVIPVLRSKPALGHAARRT